MGTAEPPEHWAPPDSLDPTPVWKQYVLVGALVLFFVALAAVYGAAAVAPDVVRPPALVPGNRLVLSTGEYPPGTTKLVDLAGAGRAFYLVRFSLDDAIAVRARWGVEPGREDCAVSLRATSGFEDSCTRSAFDARGDVATGTAPRALDRYLVSRKGDRLIVNLDRPITGASRR